MRDARVDWRAHRPNHEDVSIQSPEGAEAHVLA